VSVVGCEVMQLVLRRRSPATG